MGQGRLIDRNGIRRRALGFAVSIVSLHLWMDLVYRSWALEYGWRDAGLASSFTQLTAILGIACVIVLRECRPSVEHPPPLLYFVIVPTLAMLASEFVQIWLPATFDVQDLLYCLVGGLLNWLMLKYGILRRHRG